MIFIVDTLYYYGHIWPKLGLKKNGSSFKCVSINYITYEEYNLEYFFITNNI